MKKHLRTAIIGVFALAGVAIVSFFIIEYKAVEIPESECKIAEGTVREITQGGAKDAIFVLEGNDTRFYINRGLDGRYPLPELNRKVLGKKVRICFSDYKSVLAVNDKYKHIRKLNVEDSIFYSEY